MFIGQSRIKGILDKSITTAKKLDDIVPHVLLYGKAGYGKTTMAYYISKQVDTNFHHLIGPKVSYKDICLLAAKVKERDVAFIDEIHSLNREAEEFLYPLIEEFKLIYKNESFDVKKFTLVGSTTNIGGLSKPLVDRFTYNLHLDSYTKEELLEISEQKAEKLNIQIDQTGHELIVKSCKDTPRIINNLVHAVRDYTIAENNNTASKVAVEEVLKSLDIENGLNKLDREYLKLLSYSPVGLSQLASMLGTDISTVENTIEPYLIEKGLVTKTPRGRIKRGSSNNEDIHKILEKFS